MNFPVTIDVAERRDLPWIAELELHHYGSMRAVAWARLVEWYEANPCAFLILRQGLERLGHATLLPLRPDILRELVDGSKGEDGIEGKDLFGVLERREVRGIYIESLIAQPSELLGELVRTFELHVSRIADCDLVEALYVCPLTADGERIATNLRFQPVPRSNSASDRPLIYRAECSTLLRHTAVLRRTLDAIHSSGRAARPAAGAPF